MVSSAVVGYAASALFLVLSSDHATTRGALEFGIVRAIPALTWYWIAGSEPQRGSSGLFHEQGRRRVDRASAEVRTLW